MKPSNYQTWGSCRIPQSPAAKLASQPPPVRPASHPPPGAGYAGSPWPPTPLTRQRLSGGDTAGTFNVTKRPQWKKGGRRRRAGRGLLEGGPSGSCVTRGACGRGLRDARSVWDVRDARTMRAVSPVPPCTVPGHAFKKAFVESGCHGTLRSFSASKKVVPFRRNVLTVELL